MTATQSISCPVVLSLIVILLLSDQLLPDDQGSVVDNHRLILEVIGPEQHHLLPIWVEGDLSVNRGGAAT